MKDELHGDYPIRTIQQTRYYLRLSFLLHPSAFILGKERIDHVPA